MNNSQENTQNSQPQAEAKTNEKKFGRVAALGATIALGAGVLAVSVPEGDTQSPVETSITQAGNTQPNNAPQKELPGTKFDELSGTSLTLAPNPRRAAPEAPAQEQIAEVSVSPVEEPKQENDHKDKPKKDNHEIDLSDDIVYPLVPEETTPEPTPPVEEVTPTPTPEVPVNP
jgi:hypothetical protein